MNVYFCDVCGVRVTDIDLHSGHGIRRRHDVICAACLDLGHGKEWINGTGAVSSNASASAGAAVAAPRPKAPAPAPVVPAIKRARDDLATIDDGADEASPSAPVDDEELPAARTPGPPALSQAPIFDEEDSNVIPAPAPAASTPPPEDDSGGIGALTGVDEVLDGVPMAPQGETDAGVPNPFENEDASEAPAASAADVASGRAPAERPAKKESSRQPKAGKAPSGKSARISGKSGKGKKSASPVVLISAVSIICLLVCFGVAMATGMIPGMQSKPQVTINPNDNLSALTAAVSATRSAYSKAMSSQKLDDVNAALAKMDDLRSQMKTTEDVLKSMKPPWTDEQIGRSFEDHHVNDVLGLRKALADLRVKLSN